MNTAKSLRVCIDRTKTTIPQLSDAFGLSQAAVFNLLKNKEFSGKNIRKASEYFGMKASEFIALGEE